MCGIAGVVSLDGRPASDEVASRLIRAMAHRGPDGSGRYRDQRIAMEHLRLSILDPSPAGAQPMSRFGLHIIHNGEIYNYHELAEELSGAGFSFSTGTDTEVMLAAYRHWGEDAITRFNGMWAFALWDPDRRTLLLSRDRMGVKPLYYRRSAGSLAFASEVQALASAGPLDQGDYWSPTPDLGAVRDYLARAMVDHSVRTFVDGIVSLPAGANLVITDAQASVRRYWGPPQLSDDPSAARPGDARRDDDLVDQFDQLFRSSVRLRLRSDVPLGSCISGGVDSSSVVATTAELIDGSPDGAVRNEQAPRFGLHARFPAHGVDESRFAAEAAEAARLRIVYATPAIASISSVLDTLLDVQGEPFTSSSVYAQWSIMRAAGENGLKVLLDGQGGDEVVAGYPRYFGYRTASLLQAGRPAAAAAELRSQVAAGTMSASGALRGAMRAMVPSFADAALRGLGRGRFGVTLTGELAKVPSLVQNHSQPGTALARKQWQDLAAESLPALLRYEDRNSMAFGIESRVPFLDYRLVEFALQLPDRLKVSGGWSKSVLRRAMAGRVPRSILERRDKMGFATPESAWLTAALPEVRTMLLGGQVVGRGWVGAAEVERLVESPHAGGTNLWRVLCLEAWLRRHWPGA
jgi:asparagine synthase (glutamine-hydrolysing)